MGASYGMDVTINGVEIEDVGFTWDLTPKRLRRGEPRPAVKSPVDGWAVEVPKLLAMVDAIESTGGDFDTLREVLLGTITELLPNGCCPTCEEYASVHQDALAAYEEAAAQMAARAATMTDETHPFVVTRSAAIHLWKCPAAPREELIHPGATLKEFIHGKVVDGRRDPFQRPPWEYEPTNGVRRMTGDELAEWIRSVRGPKGGDNYRRCNRCQPALPVAYTSAASDAYLKD
ncbi:hypothetical protein [Micromonospora sp. WMMD737]|uniref:hypothetical protein n=1 Tax=Micromonospora sp. WMMD737 TaxID=3404113 RepID=UPI003B93C4F5